MATYDIVMIGHISKDIIIDRGVESRILGGAVIQSSAAARRSGARVFVVTKASSDDADVGRFFEAEGTDVRIIPSRSSTSIRNVYESEDRDRRTATLLNLADPFVPEELSGIESRIFHLAGLFVGEIPDPLIELLHGRGEVALDVQGVVRHSEGGELRLRDWQAKKRFLPFVAYLKTDAAEAEILTGTGDREKAARILRDLGAKEVMITHSSEVIVLEGEKIHRAPFTSRNLSGRTGRGDTCFASYLAWRLGHDAEESVRFAAALTSVKMESPGPFAGSIESVKDRMRESRK